ncbi:MAG: STAS-like domain-containing protein [Rhodocyclaceae bacterium]|jgi:hypothetical protein|nr:STAS-like domain-containing protein [Rhodocyclaceae bacterium]MCA3141999.1 STAS-like domain-containing protein [Rhodocyclaceae bacterium]MCA3144908.1 STAS-like domain-containing protein [Rhodocyclaceae bacterium]MCE2899262.1 STAS-like domain-containing protein [Betaproteobacteria bacterium]
MGKSLSAGSFSAQDKLVINLALDFSRHPAGRFLTDGPFSGQRFREEFLVPALKKARTVVIRLDGARGYGSSFLEEAFGGLVREEQMTVEDVLARVRFESSDPSVLLEITEYIKDASPKKSQATA